MEQILKHLKVLKIRVDNNPLLIIDVFVTKFKGNENSEYENLKGYKNIKGYENIIEKESLSSDVLFIGLLTNVITSNELKKYFAKYGNMISYIEMDKNNLENKFKSFTYCAFIKYKDDSCIENILSFTNTIDNIIDSSNKCNHYISLEEINLLNYAKNYFYDNYNYSKGKRILMDEIRNFKITYNKKIKKKLVDSDGFIIVSNNKEIFNINSVFSKNINTINYVKRKKRKNKDKTHNNFYLFKKKVRTH